MNEICEDNRFEIIEHAKKRLIEATNIESRPEEMAVLDNILFRMWQMEWLPGQEHTCKMIPFVEEDGSIFIVNCSECGDAILARGGEYDCNYCPNCGAKVVK